MADTYSTKKINELDTVNSADDSDIMMVGKTSTGTTSAITKGNFLKEVTTTLNSHAGEIVTNAENITTNAGEIKTNANNIAQNTADISTNAADIATNAEEIDKLNSALAELDSAQTPTASDKISFTPTNASAYSNYGGCWYYKIGQKVHVHIGVSGLTANTSTAIGSIPSGYRPTDSSYSSSGMGGSVAVSSVAVVEMDGNIRVASGNSYANVDIEYYIF